MGGIKRHSGSTRKGSRRKTAPKTHSKALFKVRFASGWHGVAHSVGALAPTASRSFQRPNALRILNRAASLFGSQQIAQEWMEEPSLWLDNRSPIDLVGNRDGLRQVEEYLGQVESGVYV